MCGSEAAYMNPKSKHCLRNNNDQFHLQELIYALKISSQQQ